MSVVILDMEVAEVPVEVGVLEEVLAVLAMTPLLRTRARSLLSRVGLPVSGQAWQEVQRLDIMLVAEAEMTTVGTAITAALTEGVDGAVVPLDRHLLALATATKALASAPPVEDRLLFSSHHRGLFGFL